MMSTTTPPGALNSPAAERNRQPILSVLRVHLPKRGTVLEIAAGTGEHAVYNAGGLPDLLWQPTDRDDAALASIEAWRTHAAHPNLLPGLKLDAADPDAWPVDHADAVVNINMVHISAWAATVGLMTGAQRVLPAGGKLFLYGPYFERDLDPAPSNLAFHSSLQARDPEWGLRYLEDVAALAAQHGLDLTDRIAMPANNLSLLFRRV